MRRNPAEKINLFVGASLLVIASSLTVIGFFSIRDVSLVHYRGLPAPLQVPSYELFGQRMRCWNANCIELYHDGSLHFIVLEGLACPPESHPFAKKSRNELLKITRRQMLRVEVTRQDAYQRAIGRVHVSDLDLNLHLIKHGFAWYNGDKFPGWEEFQAAEEEAKARGAGYWNDGQRRVVTPPCTDG